MARVGSRSPLPAAPHLQPAGHTAALPVRQRQLQPGLQGPRPRADPAASRRRPRARDLRRRRRARVQRPRCLPCGSRARSQPPAIGGAALDRCLVGSRRARRSERARPPRQPQRADAGQGHLATGAGADRADGAGRARALRRPAAGGRGLRAARVARSPAVKVALAYGSDGRSVDLPEERTTVVEPLYPRAVADERAAVLEALRRPVAGPPLREVVRGRRTVAISICDGTRPQPRHVVVPAILEELDGLVSLDDVVVLVATGTHRGNTEAELRSMLGDEVLESVRVLNHDARDDGTLTWMGRFGADVPVWLNSEWARADVRITTGFVEPHFFAGFSGGPKLVAPGLAGLETVLVLHDARRIGHPNATWGVTEGNPIHDDVREIARMVGVQFSVDVTLNRAQKITAVFAGDLFAEHRAACQAATRDAMRAVDAPFDVVLTTNSGFPLDQNLYQAVKGMSAAAKVVRPGGTIVCAAECSDGFPGHGSYRQLLEASA